VTRSTQYLDFFGAAGEDLGDGPFPFAMVGHHVIRALQYIRDGPFLALQVEGMAKFMKDVRS
jgi:hypothetical protein